MTINTMFGSYGGIFFQTSRYVADGSLYLQAWNIEDGPIATLTTCLDDKSLGENETYLDTNNCPWVLDFMVKNGLATPTGMMRQSGYCMYPRVKVHMDEILKHVFSQEG